MFVKAPQLWRDEDGVNTLEYALLLALIAAAGVAAYDKIGSLIRDSVTQTTAEMSAEQAGL